MITIGGSRGGFQALCKLASLLPPEFAAVILVALHTHPDSPRLLVDMVSRQTSLKVTYGQSGEAVKEGTIYIAPPPDRHLVVAGLGVIGLSDGPKVQFTRPAVDPLFESVARFYGPNANGIVLSGGGHDGTDGLRAIKAGGGIGIVQSLDEAADPSMPQCALSSAGADYCEPLDRLATLLVLLVADAAHSTALD